MKKFGKLTVVICLSGALCLGLTGCFYTPFAAARDAARGVQRAASNLFGGARNFFFGAGHDAWDKAADSWDDAWTDVSDEWDGAWDEAAGSWYEAYTDLENEFASLPGIGEMLDEQDNPYDHREAFSHTGQNEASLRLEVKNASNIILRQSGSEDSYQFEYDPSIFRVDTESKGGVLTLSVTQLRYPRHKEDDLRSYKCYLTIPARNYESLLIHAAGAGVCADGLTTSFSLNADDSGFTVSGCQGDVTLNATDCGFAVELPRDYASRFQLTGKGLGFSLRFPDGEPENLLVRADGPESFIVAPSSWGNLFQRWEHRSGDGSVLVDLSVSDSAGSITVGD